MCQSRHRPQLPCVPESARVAREWVSAELAARCTPRSTRRLTTSRVVVSELVTNCVQTQAHHFALGVDGHHARLTWRTTDDAPGMPHPASGGPRRRARPRARRSSTRCRPLGCRHGSRTARRCGPICPCPASRGDVRLLGLTRSRSRTSAGAQDVQHALVHPGASPRRRASRSSRVPTHAAKSAWPRERAPLIEFGREFGVHRDAILRARGGQVEVAQVEQPGEFGDRLARGRRRAGRRRRRPTRRSRRPRARRAALRTAARAGHLRPRRRPRGRRTVGVRAAARRSRPTTASSPRRPAGPTRMLPWIATPGSAMPPAQSRHSPPVCVADGAGGVDDPELPVGALRVLGDQPLHHLRRGQPLVEQRHPGDLPRHVGLGLGRQCADARDGGGTTCPTARNFEATATPHDSPSSERATMEKVIPVP